MSNAERLPPQNLEAERGTLGSMLHTDAVIDDIRPIVNPEDFYRAAHQVLAARIFQLRDASKPVDVLSVTDDLRRTGDYERIGGDAFVEEILHSVPHAVNGPYYAGIVAGKAKCRRLIEAANGILSEVYAADKSPEDLQALAESAVLGVREHGERETTVDGYTAVRESLRLLEERASGKSRRLTATGIVSLDIQLEGGFDAGDMVILAARPSIGKTALATNIAAHVAYQQGKGVLFISCEMGRTKITDRMLAFMAGVPAPVLKSGRLNPVDYVNVGRVEEQIRDCNLLWIDDAPAQQVGRIAALARRLARKSPLGLIVIDYLQLLKPPADIPKRANRQEVVTAISADIKRLARDLETPVLALSQLNRAAESRDTRRPQLAELRDSGSLEQDADVVMLLHRPEFYDAGDRPGEADVIVAKNRNGAVGDVKLTYAKELTQFYDFAPAPAPLVIHEPEEPF